MKSIGEASTKVVGVRASLGAESQTNKQTKTATRDALSFQFSPHSDHNWSSDRVCCVGEYLFYHSLCDIDKAKRIFEVSRNALTWRPIDARTRAQCLNGLQ